MTSPANGVKNKTGILGILAKRRELIPLSLIIIYFISFSFLFPKVFPTLYNISSILLEWSIPAIMVCGMAIVLISKEIDLSIGYNVMFSGLICSSLIIFGVPIPLAIIMTLLFSVLFGFIIGTLIIRLGINSLIVTLAFGNVYYGLSQFIYDNMYPVQINNAAITALPSSFVALGRFQMVKGLNFGIPIIYAIVVIAIILIYSNTKTFRQYYYIGSNYEAARLSGINTKKIKTSAFMISALLSSICGIILAARLGSCNTMIGTGMEMQAITAAVIGGVSFTGGQGRITGALIGAFFTVCLYNGFGIASVSSSLYNIFMGGILLLALMTDAVFSRVKKVG